MFTQLATAPADFEIVCIDDGPENTQRQRADYLPTPAEIQEACRRIRAGWSMGERHRRRVASGVTRWRVPEFTNARAGLGGAGKGERNWIRTT